VTDSPSRADPGYGATPAADGGQADGSHDHARWRAFEWADPAIAAAAARKLDGITFFRELVAGRIPPPPIAAALGFTLVSVEPGNGGLRDHSRRVSLQPLPSCERM
jgi:hypothetical protein